jgi:hypothetical protein
MGINELQVGMLKPEELWWLNLQMSSIGLLELLEFIG